MLYIQRCNTMKKKASLSIGSVLLAIVAAFFLPGGQGDIGETNSSGAGSTQASPERGDRLPASSSDVGFTSPRSLLSHFEKHGRQVGAATSAEYLAHAKALRDAPRSATVLELIRSDGVITRFDKSAGRFVAFHRDKTIRTFFRPNDGEDYFRRQARR